jgi:hypothetical protein
MYDASDPARIPWLRQGWIVRETWLNKARQSLEGAGHSLDRFNLWRKIKLLLVDHADEVNTENWNSLRRSRVPKSIGRSGRAPRSPDAGPQDGALLQKYCE